MNDPQIIPPAAKPKIVGRCVCAPTLDEQGNQIVEVICSEYIGVDYGFDPPAIACNWIDGTKVTTFTNTPVLSEDAVRSAITRFNRLRS